MVRRALRYLPHYFRRPSDPVLLLAVGAFIARMPRSIGRDDLPTLLERLARRRLLRADAERVKRMRSFWLRRRRFAAFNTCYVRALTLYRFLDARGGRLALHFGVERRDDRLHGHAWVTIDGTIVEGPPEAFEGRLSEIRIPTAS